MKEKNIVVKSDFDANNSALFVQNASKYPCNVYLKIDSKTANAKSIMGMISLSILSGTEITLITDGEKEEEAMGELLSYLGNL